MTEQKSTPSAGPDSHPGATDERLTRVARLLRGWEDGDQATLAERLAAAVVDLIDQGELPAGFRIPSERRLAETLAVSRGTVTAAYGQLKQEGWLDSRVGSGSTVMSIKGRVAADRTRVDGRLTSIQQGATGHVDLTSGALAGLELTDEIAVTALRERLPKLLGSGGYEPRGLAELRLEVARYYDELGAATRPEQIAVTTGSQQALQLLADVFIAPGDVVLVEDPTYRGAIEVFRSRGAKLVPLPVTSEGPDPSTLERMLARLHPRFVYLLPTAHNPTGYVASRSRAAAIAKVLDASEAIFIEDGSPADLLLDRTRPPTPIGAAMAAERWVAIGSMSKLFWGGLRVGWIRGSDAVIQRVTRLKTVADLGTSLVSQAIAVECLRAVDLARRERREELTAGLEVAAGLLDELAPEWSWQPPRGGSALWVRVPDVDTRALAEVGRRFGVSVVPGAFFSPVDGFLDHVRIPFWGRRHELRDGLQRLVAAWHELRDQHGLSR